MHMEGELDLRTLSKSVLVAIRLELYLIIMDIGPVKPPRVFNQKEFINILSRIFETERIHESE